MPDSTEGHIRIDEVLRGSQMWELASSNREIVRNLAFWEIRDGRSAWFWEEGWQQWDHMNHIPTLHIVQQRAQRAGLQYVRDYWKNETENDIWRVWKRPEELDETISQEVG